MKYLACQFNWWSTWPISISLFTFRPDWPHSEVHEGIFEIKVKSNILYYKMQPEVWKFTGKKQQRILYLFSIHYVRWSPLIKRLPGMIDSKTFHYSYTMVWYQKVQCLYWYDNSFTDITIPYIYIVYICKYIPICFLNLIYSVCINRYWFINSWLYKSYCCWISIHQ